MLARLAPLIEQVANSAASVLLTLLLAAILTPAQFGVVAYLLITLQFILFVVDSIFGAPIFFDHRAGGYTRALRRGTLIAAGLVALALAYVAALPLLMALRGAMREPLVAVGGLAVVAATVAAYCLALALFEHLRRTSYATDNARMLLRVNAARCLVLAAVFVAVRAGWARLDLHDCLALATGLLLAGSVVLLEVLLRAGQLAWRPKGLRDQWRYIRSIVQGYGPFAGTTIAYGALELMVVTGMMAFGQAEAVARYRGLQLALLVVNLLATATENANAARRMMSEADWQARFRQSVAFLTAAGAVVVGGFLLIGKPVIGLALGAELVPTTFELMCGAALMAAQVLRTPAAILLKFAGRFSLMFHVYAGAAIGELALLVALYRAGHGGHALAALVIASIVSSLIIVAHGWPLLRSCRPVRARG